VSSLVEAAAQIVAAHVKRNKLSADDLLVEISKVHAALKKLEAGGTAETGYPRALDRRPPHHLAKARAVSNAKVEVKRNVPAIANAVLNVPNAKTRAAMKEADEIVKAHRARFASGKDLFDDLEKNCRK
jgi:hypothetical protein